MILKVLKSKTEDTLAVADAVKRTLEEERQLHPQVQLTVINDQSDLVQSRISLLVRNGLQGYVLVFLTMWIFLTPGFHFGSS